MNLPAPIIQLTAYDTKPYDRMSLQRATADSNIDWHFRAFRLTKDTAFTAQDAPAVRAFVDDELDHPCLEGLARDGIRPVALRCTGCNSTDLSAAREIKLTVTIN